MDMNQFTFRHSSLKLPLNDSINALSTGFPGLEKLSFTPLSYTKAIFRHPYLLDCFPGLCSDEDRGVTPNVCPRTYEKWHIISSVRPGTW